MKNFIIGLFAGFIGGISVIALLATGYEEAFDKMVDSWRTI